MDLDSRIALVGPNGAGKSTLLKLMTGELEALDGMVKRHNHLKIGVYHQHLTELLDPELNPLEYMVRAPAPVLQGSCDCVCCRPGCDKSNLQPACSQTLHLRVVLSCPLLLQLDNWCNALQA